jgi:hypothetical protein
MIKQLELFELCDKCEENYTSEFEINFGWVTWWCEDCTDVLEEKSYWDV